MTCFFPPRVVEAISQLPTIMNSNFFYTRLNMQINICNLYFALHVFFSPAVEGQNCSFFDKSIKLGRVTDLYETNIS